MANMTLSVPDELHAEMKRRDDVSWSAVARRALEEKVAWLRQVDEIERIAQKSKLTQQDVEEIGRKIKKGAAKRFRDDMSRLTRTS